MKSWNIGPFVIYASMTKNGDSVYELGGYFLANCAKGRSDRSLRIYLWDRCIVLEACRRFVPVPEAPEAPEAPEVPERVDVNDIHSSHTFGAVQEFMTIGSRAPYRYQTCKGCGGFVMSGGYKKATASARLVAPC